MREFSSMISSAERKKSSPKGRKFSMNYPEKYFSISNVERGKSSRRRISITFAYSRYIALQTEQSLPLCARAISSFFPRLLCNFSPLFSSRSACVERKPFLSNVLCRTLF